MKRLFLLSMCLLSLSTTFAQETDSLKTQHINEEVVVTAQNHVAIKDGVSYIPTPEERKSSSNYAALLARMMVAGLRVDEFSNKVETNWGKEVHFFINGVEANGWELKTLRPKEVARVDFLQSPSEPKYKNYSAVVDFVLRKLAYGGYVMAEANQGFGNNDYGDYDVAGKLRKGRMTYQAIVGTYYRNAHKLVGNKNIDYTYNDGTTLNKKVDYEQNERLRTYSTGVSARYDSEKLIWSLQAGMRLNEVPRSHTQQHVFYDDVELGSSISDADSRSITPYLTSQFVTYGLPHNGYAYGGFSFSYNHNSGNNHYQLMASDSQELYNGTKENAYLPSLWLGYGFPIYQQNYLVFTTSLNTEIYRTNYSGTADTFQKLINTYYSFDLNYSHKFSGKWSGSLLVSLPVQSYKVQDEKVMTKAYLNGRVTLNGQLSSKHSIYIQANITQSAINPSYYNTVVRQDDELTGSKGNADLKTVRQAYALLSYTWMPSNVFSLNTSCSWDNIINDIVPYWHEINGLMVKEMINSGSYNPLYVNVTPSMTLMNGKLRISSNVSYMREWHSGLFHINNAYWGVYPSAYLGLGKYWALNVNYTYSSGKGYMRGSSNLTRFSDNLKCGVQYSKGNLFAKLQVNSLFLKKGYTKTWLVSDNIGSYTYQSRPWDRRYMSLSISYTFDYGKKIKHDGNLRFEGKSKSSVL